MIDEILGSFTKTLEFLQRLVADVPDQRLTHQPVGVVNHPAWIIGHLAYSFQLIGIEMGLKPWLPEYWDQKFGTGSMPGDTRDDYPSKADLLDRLSDGQRRVGDRLKSLGENDLAKPLPDVRLRPVFPTLGHAVLHVLTSHAAVHVGQLSVWRRAIGLEPLKEVFH
jgi:hypothetical protein